LTSMAVPPKSRAVKSINGLARAFCGRSGLAACAPAFGREEETFPRPASPDLRPGLLSIGPAGLRYLRGLVCGLVALGLAAGAAAQTAPPRKKPRSARAVALLEWHKDAKGVLAPRLVPISLLWEGKYYDAGLYEASPRPLALEPGTVYEAMRVGVPAGLFTVRGGVSVKGAWYGDGVWSPGATGSARTASSNPGDDERPRLHRAGSASASTSTAPAEMPGSTASPRAPEPSTNDPNRPTLHRGKPTTRTVESPVTTSVAPKAARTGESPAPTKLAAKPAEKPAPLVAVSDAESQETRPYVFPWNRDEEERLTGEMKALAAAEVARQAGGGTPSLDQVQVRAFDLNTDNLAEIVLSARASVAKAAAKGKKPLLTTYYVTVVARTTVSGELRKLFASVTSSAWLGSVPRMEVVDAVDADGDGPAELLFALISDSGRSYAIYRVGRDELFKLVETGPIPND
jgi:hypothetical protein